MLFADTDGRAFYTSDDVGQSPIEVWSLDSGEAEHWGWWLTDEKIIVAERKVYDESIYWFYYLVDIQDGTAEMLDPATTWWVYEVAPDGSFWIEKGEETFIAHPDGTRELLWEEGEVITDISPRPAYLSVYSDSSGLVFIGCTEDRELGNRYCAIYEVQILPDGVSIANEIYKLGDIATAHSITVSSENRYIGFVSELMKVTIIEMDTGKIIQEIALPDGVRSTPGLIWGPDPTLLAINYETTNGEVLIIYNLSTDEKRILNTEDGLRVVDWILVSN